jgi:uncharacterized RmlC-like cupin family protein
MAKVKVVSTRSGKLEYYAGVGWRPTFETDTDQVGEIRVGPHTTGGWHHHGKRTLYGYVVSGKSTLEFGKNRKDRVILSSGDFFQVPPGLVHRDVNPYSEEAIIMVFNIGPGPASFDVKAED